MISFFQKQAIVHESACVDTLQQNGIVERKNRHLFEVGDALLMSLVIKAF